MVESSAANNSSLPVISVSDLRFNSENTTCVVSEAYKFILPIPAWSQAEPLIYPPGHSSAGAQIVDYQHQPIGENGIVFFNSKDRSWQAAPADGTAIIIINEVSPAQAAQLYEKVRSLSGGSTELTLSQLKATLTYAHETLGLDDMYNSTAAYALNQLVSIVSDQGSNMAFGGLSDEVYGFKKRHGEKVGYAVYLPEAFALEGVAATQQLFSNGGVIVKQSEEFCGVQPDIFMRTYRLANGHPIVALQEDIAIWQM